MATAIDSDEYLAVWMELSAAQAENMKRLRENLLAVMDLARTMPEATLRHKAMNDAQELLHEAWHRLWPDED